MEIDQILENSISLQRNSLTTDRLDMSYGEIMNMYELNELIISPQFQRLFRWDNEQRTRFIESLLLGIPIPPIFVAEDKDGKWELVDGLQRISTILSFFNILKNNKVDNNWTLQSGSLVAELDGYTISNLPEKFVRNIKRTYCRVEIIKWDSKYDMRYELFNRLNTGGSALTEQEIRNCIFRGISEEFNNLLKLLSEDKEFNRLINIGEIKTRQLYNEELVLRFFALYFTELEDIDSKNMSQFITNYMKTVIKENSFDFEVGKNIFMRTISTLSKMDGGIFKFVNNQFSTSLFDAIMIGIAKNIKYFELNEIELPSLIEKLKVNTDFRKYVGSAASGKSRVVKRMTIAIELFKRNDDTDEN